MKRVPKIEEFPNWDFESNFLRNLGNKSCFVKEKSFI